MRVAAGVPPSVARGLACRLSRVSEAPASRRRPYVATAAASAEHRAAGEPQQQNGSGGGGGDGGTAHAAHDSISISSSSSSSSSGLQAEVRELRDLLVRQQQTIAALEERVLGGQAAPAAAAAACEGPGQQQAHQHQQPLDGPEAVMQPSVMERRVVGTYSPRYHTTTWGGATRDLALLPRRIILVRHAESKGNVDPFQYTHVPDPSVPLTKRGWEQAIEVGEKLHSLLAADGGDPSRLFCYTSPYLRCKQTVEGLVQAFSPDQLLGVQEEVMLREQDFGNFQDAEGKKREQRERLRFGRFFYRFPHGESGADVHQRMTIFQDHLVRDMDAGRFGDGCTLLLVSHGLASRIFLMRWFHWTVEQFLAVWNPENAEPIILERIPEEMMEASTQWMHTKALYRLSESSRAAIPGITEDMCATTWTPRGLHWHDAQEASPEDAPQALRQCSVSYQ